MNQEAVPCSGCYVLTRITISISGTSFESNVNIIEHNINITQHTGSIITIIRFIYLPYIHCVVKVTKFIQQRGCLYCLHTSILMQNVVLFVFINAFYMF